jgi:hypothetical protein
MPKDNSVKLKMHWTCLCAGCNGKGNISEQKQHNKCRFRGRNMEWHSGFRSDLSKSVLLPNALGLKRYSEEIFGCLGYTTSPQQVGQLGQTFFLNKAEKYWGQNRECRVPLQALKKTRPTLRSRPIESFAEGRRRGEFEIRQSESRQNGGRRAISGYDTGNSRGMAWRRDRPPRHSRRQGALPLHLLPEPGAGPLPCNSRALTGTFHKFGARRVSITVR